MSRILTLIFISTAFLQAEGIVTFEKIVRYKEVVAGHTIEVAIHQGEYDFSGHKFTGGTDGSPDPAKIDGVEIAGTDGRSPLISDSSRTVFETVREIRLKWDGEDIVVPKSLHINLLNLTLREDRIQFIPRPSGEELLIQATGGDGGASYLVSLVLGKNGSHKQYECGYEESGLRPFPFEISEFVRTTDEDRAVFNTFTWLEPNAEQDGTGQPATRPESKSEGGDQPQPEAEGRSR